MAKRLLLFDVPSLVPALLKTALKPAGLFFGFRDVLQRNRCRCDCYILVHYTDVATRINVAPRFSRLVLGMANVADATHFGNRS